MKLIDYVKQVRENDGTPMMLYDVNGDLELYSAEAIDKQLDYLIGEEVDETYYDDEFEAYAFTLVRDREDE